MRGVVVCSVAAFAAALAWGGKAPASDEPESDTEAVAHLLFFSGTDVWRNGGFLHGGFLYAYQGLNQGGPVFKLLFNGGFYRFHAGGSEITGRQVMAAALPGWRWNRPGFELTVFAGLDAQNHRYTPDDTANRLRGTHLGVRGGFDVWCEPFADWMLTGSASLSTVGKSYWTRAASGHRFFDAIWLGPEFLASGDDTYRQLRFGAHVTSLRMGGAEWSAGAGWVTDTDRRDGVYGRVGVLIRK
jgi:cellulose biosynthesis protein BcsS